MSKGLGYSVTLAAWHLCDVIFSYERQPKFDQFIIIHKCILLGFSTFVILR